MPTHLDLLPTSVARKQGEKRPSGRHASVSFLIKGEKRMVIGFPYYVVLRREERNGINSMYFIHRKEEGIEGQGFFGLNPFLLTVFPLWGRGNEGGDNPQFIRSILALHH